MAGPFNRRKPPLGIKPEWLHELERIQELIRALFDYSQQGIILEIDSTILFKWADELRWRLHRFSTLRKEKFMKKV